MELSFYKYQGTGNDFVMIDNRDEDISKNDTILVKRLCDRKFGIGADGLILLEKPASPGEDFTMIYFNADGNQSSMCGNGGRCIAAFAEFLGVVRGEARFTAIDGFHQAVITDKELVGLEMKEVTEVEQKDSFVFLDTGSPHHVIFTEGIDSLDVKKEGAEIRNSETYINKGGTNVNFVEAVNETTFKVRTFERGVEDETLSCGTGVTAVALAAYATGRTGSREVNLETRGGSLKVSFQGEGRSFRNIWLTGRAEQVFKGTIQW